MANLLSGHLIVPKYGDHGTPIISVMVEEINISNVLVDLGATINVMTKDLFKRLELIKLQPTTTVL